MGNTPQQTQKHTYTPATMHTTAPQATAPRPARAARKPAKNGRPLATMAHLHGRCIECGDCLLWQGSHSGTGHPRYSGGSVRRAVWALARGPLPADRLVTVTCGQVACLNPAHLTLTTRGAVTTRVHNRPDVKLRRSAACARANQAGMGKIDMAAARQIRASTQTGVALARYYGVSTSLISLVRRGKTWVERTASPWRGLGA